MMAAGIEIATGRGGPRQGPPQAAMSGVGGDAGMSATHPASAQEGAQSFRSRWQSLLVSAGLTNSLDTGTAQTDSQGALSSVLAGSSGNAGAASFKETHGSDLDPAAVELPGLQSSVLQSSAAKEAASPGKTDMPKLGGVARKPWDTGRADAAMTKALGEKHSEHKDRIVKKKSAAERTPQAPIPQQSSSDAVAAVVLVPVLNQPAQVVARLSPLSSNSNQTESLTRSSGLSAPAAMSGGQRAVLASIPAASATDAGGGMHQALGLTSTPANDTTSGIPLPEAAHGPEQALVHAVNREASFASPAVADKGTDPLAATAGASSADPTAFIANANRTATPVAEQATSKRISQSERVKEMHGAATQRAHAAGQAAGATLSNPTTGSFNQERSKPDQFDSMLPQDMSGARSFMGPNASTAPPTLLPAGSEAPTAADTFAALDSGSATPSSAWIHAGAHHAEAGFQDPALGWVGVRAQVDANGVHASLLPGSADAAQALSSHLAGLHAHLTDHHTPVQTLTMATPRSEWGGQNMGQETGQNPGQGTRHGGYSGGERDSSTGASAVVSMGGPQASAIVGRSVTPSEGLVSKGASGGTYISVMA